MQLNMPAVGHGARLAVPATKVTAHLICLHLSVNDIMTVFVSDLLQC